MTEVNEVGPAEETAALIGSVDRDARRALLTGDDNAPEGIDFVEVLSNREGTVGHVPRAPASRTLLIHLLRGPVPIQWDGTRVSVVGGVRTDPALNPVGVAWAYPSVRLTGGPGNPTGDPLPDVTPADRELVSRAVPPAVRDRVFVVRTTTHGDLSRYLLRVVGPDGVGLPDELDPPLAQDGFAFAVDCPSDFDCAQPPDPLVPELASPILDYLARDYDALRTRLLDRVAALVPGWTDQNPADIAVMLVELFAQQGDRLAYWQDAIGGEAYLTSARRRVSVRRHARLLGYQMHDGCSARTWLAVRTDTPFPLTAGTPIADTVPDQRTGLPVGPGSRTPAAVVEVGGVVFETTTDLDVRPERNAIPLHTWGDPVQVLPAGTTAAFLAVPAGDAPLLHAGDVLVLAELPVGGAGSVDLAAASRDGDPRRRHAVRLDRDPVVRHDALTTATVLEIRWGGQDALPWPLTVAERGPDGQPVSRAVALANVVLAEQGASIAGDLLDPPQVVEGEPYRPRVRRPHLAYVQRVDPHASATTSLRADPRRAGPALWLGDGAPEWIPHGDLIGSDRLDKHFVVENDDTGVARLRFGDGVAGRRPPVGAVLRATYRVGAGAHGNVAAGRLTHLLDRPGATSLLPAGVMVWNPLPAIGGTDPEPIEVVRQLSPYAFRHQLRAVTPRDYADLADAQEGVQRAVARARWTGSWYAEEVTVDPVAARAEDPSVPEAVLQVAELRRMAGVDVEVARPVYVPLQLVIEGCVAPGYLRADAERQLVDAFSSRLLPGGRRGFFHPDAFTFGQPLYLSDVVAAAMAVPAVDWVEVTRFARADAGQAEAASTLASGHLPVAPREVLRCDSDPNNPESGRVDIILRGGS